MSRVGRMPISIPQGVEVKIEDDKISVKGPKGNLTKELHKDVQVEIENNQIMVKRASDKKEHRALHGLTRALIANMIEGVTKGFEKKLELVGVGFRANKQGDKLVLSVGYSHPVEIVPDEGIEIEVPAPNKIVVRGLDKEKVGVFAANIRKIREPEPYKGKGIKYEGEQIKRKVGKAGAKA
ncbi:50S ribosomal protein L6 [Calderihabitans maritimus]|uniref:Large ribosomal subunit protein uL6 n=1 Tax=Calderihabitans maritimus TaxID=1246530 RepID=A0A1Z5HNL5_9FIRM|nr:50S ribosomal protein L6 [Calderihabitans maritimus]GAW90895.1 50S ribosomal protein L6 [Calderihabitans maritimus]